MSAVSTRLTGGEIIKIIKQGKRKDSNVLIIYWQKTSGEYHKRAIIISKQVDKRAVVRNRLRRIISEQIRSLGKEVGGYNLVIKVKKTDVTPNSQQLRQETIKLLSISGILKISHELPST